MLCEGPQQRQTLLLASPQGTNVPRLLFPNARRYHKHQTGHCMYQAERGVPPPYQVNSPWEGREEGTKETALQECSKPRTEEADLRTKRNFYQMCQAEGILALAISPFLARSNAFQSKGYSRRIRGAAAKCPHFVRLGAKRPVRQTDRQLVKVPVLGGYISRKS